MPENNVKRKLRAILSADVKGYSRMMGEDEVGTYQTLTTSLKSIRPIISEYNGRVFSSPGDAVMAEFSSVVDAVQCAVELQEKIEGANAEVPEDRKMQFRIGVNLGDVIQDGEQVYGDGVNIAARIETLAEAGGVSISRTVYNHVYNKLKFGYEYQGEHQVKNISKPVKVYKVLTAAQHAGQLIGEPKAPKRLSKQSYISIVVVLALVVGAAIWQFYPRAPEIEPALVENMAYPLPEKPSIAVLPFVNMSGDPEQEYIGDNITENIITALSYVQEMFVIARTSTSVYKGKSVKIKQISEELGVRYVLEGSVQKEDDRIRVTAQLIDAISGHHLWANRYDRNIEEFFKVLDEIAKEVVIELQVKLTEGDVSRITHKTENFEAWLSAVTGYYFVKLGTKENIATARELFEKAARLDPEYGFAWSGLGAAHNVEGIFGWGESREKSFELAGEYIDKAIKLDEDLSCATSLKGRLYRMQGQIEQAIATGKKAIALGPSHDLPYSILSNTMRYVGRYEESIALMEKAMRLNPYYPAFYLSTLGKDYFFLQRYDEAIEVFTRLLERAQKGEYPPLYVHLDLSANYSEIGKYEEAKAHAEQVNKINPNFSLERLASDISQYKIKTDYERYLESLRKAGLPDKPPLPLPDKPSIAVLAFDNLSGDPEQEYFSDGIAENIITALSKSDQLFVIARNSSFIYKGKPVKIEKVGRELGVRYVLEGSVLKSEDRVRITAQLIDAVKGGHLWAERYDRDLKDIFALQDEITKKIVTALRIKLTEGEQARMWAEKTKNLDLYLKFMEAQSLTAKGTKESHIRLGQIGKEIVDMAPESPLGYRLLAWYNYHLAMSGKSPRESLAEAFKLAQKALSLDKSDSMSHALLGNVYLYMRKYEKAISAGERSVELEPNGAWVLVLFGNTLGYAGRLDEAIGYLNQGIRLNPFPPYWYFVILGRSYRQNGQYEEALTAYKKALHRAPDALLNHVSLAAIYALLDQQEEASAAAKKVLEIDPNYSVESAKFYPYKTQAELKLFIDSLRKAGLK